MWGRDGASGRGTPARQRSGTRPGPGAGARAAQRLRVGQMANRLLQQVHVAPAMPRTRISNRLMTSALLGRTSGGLACASRANGARAWPPAPLARAHAPGPRRDQPPARICRCSWLCRVPMKGITDNSQSPGSSRDHGQASRAAWWARTASSLTPRHTDGRSTGAAMVPGGLPRNHSALIKSACCGASMLAIGIVTVRHNGGSGAEPFRQRGGASALEYSIRATRS
jgi:hypothetical protein